MENIDLFPAAGVSSVWDEPGDLGTVVSFKPVMGYIPPVLRLSGQPLRIEKYYTRWYRLMKRGGELDKEMAEHCLDRLVEMTLFEFWELED